MAGEDKELIDKINKLLTVRFGGSTMENQKRLFDSYDKDRNGRINSDELYELLKDAGIGNGITRGAWVRGVISKMDQDRDGMISWAEYTKIIEEAQRNAR